VTAVRTMIPTVPAGGGTLTPLEKIEGSLDASVLPTPRPAQPEPEAAEPHEGDGRAAEARPAHQARVSFVGAGPGDPDLLTVRGAAALAEADVLVLDHQLIERFRPLARHDVHVVELGVAVVGTAAPAAFQTPCSEAVLRAMAGCPGSRPSRCSAGGCWCRAPRSRPAR
jgi:hypothetical protein